MNRLTFCFKFFVFRALLYAALFLFTGCTASPPDFHVKNLAKTDIDEISELHRNQSIKLLKELTRKLYKRNPYELKKTRGQTIESRIDQIFICPAKKEYQELEFKTGTDAILLCFEPEFTGDRIFALMHGLYTMIQHSYNNRCEFYMLDYLNEQNLYNSARNIEILVWRLNNRKKPDGSVLILTNSRPGEALNLSFERIFGKLICLQDTLALITSKRTGRIVKEAVQMAGMAFLPIGF